jgi:hypothetical protein
MSFLDSVNYSTDELHISVYPHESEIREGQDTSFECRAVVSGGAANPYVRWTKVGGPMPASVHNPQDSRLHFSRANVHDSGRYACVATHGGRSVEAYATLRVKSCSFKDIKL